MCTVQMAHIVNICIYIYIYIYVLSAPTAYSHSRQSTKNNISLSVSAVCIYLFLAFFSANLKSVKATPNAAKLVNRCPSTVEEVEETTPRQILAGQMLRKNGWEKRE